MSPVRRVMYAAAAAFLAVGGLHSAGQSQAAEMATDRRYCLSDICPGDSRSVLSQITLSNLGQVAERPRAGTKEARDVLKAAIPGLSDAQRMSLSAYTDPKGTLLLDARTLPIFLKIGRICAPVGPFVALFTSESGHASIIEFGAVIRDSEVQLGVTRVARIYRVNSDSTDETALIADLSRRFGFRIDAAPEKDLSAQTSGVTASFTRQDKGFLLAFSGPVVRENAAEFVTQSGCDRIKID